MGKMPNYENSWEVEAALDKAKQAYRKLSDVETKVDTISTQISSPYNFKGDVSKVADLPTEASINDTYYVTGEGDTSGKPVKCKYTWNGNGWHQSSATVDDLPDGIESEITNTKENLTALQHYTDNTATIVGLYSHEFSFGMVNASTGEIVENNYTIVSKKTRYHNERFTVKVKDDMRTRVFYLTDSGAVMGDTGWKDGTNVFVASSQEIKYLYICIRYSDSRQVAAIEDLSNYVLITPEYKNTLIEDVYNLNNITNKNEQSIEVLKSAGEKYYDATGLWWLDWHYGVINTSTGQEQSSTNRLTTQKVGYDNTDIAVVCGADIKSRIYYFREDGSVFASTSWVTGSKTYKASSPDAVSYILNVAFTNDAVIPDVYGFISKIEVKKTSKTEYETEDIATIGTFKNFGVIGDSYSRGRYKYSEANQGYSDFDAWGKIIARAVGNDCLLLGLGGTNTRTWLTAPDDRDGGAIKLMASEPQDLYFLCLGINDTSLGLDYIGTDADIKENYTQNADTFYGNYGRIIGMCKEKNPNALFMISELVATNDPTMVEAYNAAIDGIAVHFGIPVIKPTDDMFFSSKFYNNNKSYGHPTGLTYGGMAKAYMRLMSKCMHDNAAYFQGYNVPAPNDGKYRYWQGF